MIYYFLKKYTLHKIKMGRDQSTTSTMVKAIKRFTASKQTQAAFLVIKDNPKVVWGIVLGVMVIWAMSIIANQIFFSLLGMPGLDLNPLEFVQAGFIAWTDHSLKIKWLFSLAVPLVLCGFAVPLLFKGQHRTLFGKAHWASMAEARKAGLLAKKGIILTKKWGQYVMSGGYEHIFIFWPSGSGKTNSLAIPNLLNWPGSCIVNDVKLSLFGITSKYRQKHGQQCYVWNPVALDCKTHRYNPLDVVSRDKLFRIDGLQKIANTFIPQTSAQKEPIWTAIPQALFVALGLYLMDTPERPCTIGEMVRLVKNSANFKKFLWKIINERDDLDPLTYRNLISFLQTEEKLQTNLLQSFLSYFVLFDNPLIDAATSHSDFDIRDLRKKPMTIYVGISANDISRLAPLITVFYEQVVDAMLKEIPDPIKEPYDLLLLLDEFSALKRMEILRASVGLMREYRIRLMAFIQDLPQMYETYGVHGAKAFINNKIRIASVQNDHDAAALISQWLGDKTVEQRSTSAKTGFNQSIGNDSESLSFTKRPLMSPSEIMQLPKEQMIIAIEGNPPILAIKNFWQNDPQLRGRAIGGIELPTIKPVIVPFDRSTLKSIKEDMENAEKAKNPKTKKVVTDVKDEGEESLDHR